MGKYVVRAEKPRETTFKDSDRGVWDDPDDEPVVESVASRVMRPVKRLAKKRKAKRGN